MEQWLNGHGHLGGGSRTRLNVNEKNPLRENPSNL